MTKLPAAEQIGELVGVYRKRDFAAAERMARSFTRKWPEFDLGWNILSASLHARGKLDKASAAYLQAIALNPGYAELHDNFGVLLVQQGRLADAEEHFRKSIDLNPASGKTRGNLALALMCKESFHEAEGLCRTAIGLDPNNASAYNTLGNALRALDRRKEAQTAFQRAVEINPDYAEAHHNLANELQSAGLPKAAESHYRLALRSNPNYVKAHCGLGNLLAMLGRLDQAERAYRDAIDLQPDRAEAHRYLAWIKTFHEADADLERIENLLCKSGLSDGDRAQLHYAAGKGYQDIGDNPGRAFSHFLAGAALRRRTMSYDVAADEKLFKEIVRACSTPGVLRTATASRREITPVLIVGMPRSGTTLVEQIVAAHTNVYAGGESDALNKAVAETSNEHGCAYPCWVQQLSGSDLAGLATAYMHAFETRLDGAAWFTDKTPDNFRYLGIAATALPHARIIHVKRSPLDTCVSCFTQYFSSSVPYSYDLNELGRYYRAYHGLMDHWREALPEGVMLEVEYEALTRETERQAMRIIAHCGLTWQDSCLHFQQTERLIATASVVQARQPVSRRSVDRWRKYESYLEPLRLELGSQAY